MASSLTITSTRACCGQVGLAIIEVTSSIEMTLTRLLCCTVGLRLRDFLWNNIDRRCSFTPSAIALKFGLAQIFFPRSIEGEIATRDAARERKRTRSTGRSISQSMLETQAHTRSNFSVPPSQIDRASVAGTYLLTSSPVRQNFTSLPSYDGNHNAHVNDAATSPLTADKHWEDDEERDMPASLPKLPPIRPNRRRGHDVELGGIDAVSLSESNLSKHNLRQSNLNPMVHNFTSPIGVFQSLHDQTVVADYCGQ